MGQGGDGILGKVAWLELYYLTFSFGCINLKHFFSSFDFT